MITVIDRDIVIENPSLMGMGEHPLLSTTGEPVTLWGSPVLVKPTMRENEWGLESL